MTAPYAQLSEQISYSAVGKFPLGTTALNRYFSNMDAYAALPCSVNDVQSPDPDKNDQRQTDDSYLVTLVTRHRLHLFDELLIAHRAARVLDSQTTAKTLAYVIMPDHLRWLVKIDRATSLDTAVRTAMRDIGNMVNEFYGRVGPVWENAFLRSRMSCSGGPNLLSFHAHDPFRPGGFPQMVRAYSRGRSASCIAQLATRGRYSARNHRSRAMAAR